VNDVLILCYHAINDRWPDDIAVSPGEFRRQLAVLVGRGYRGTTFSDAVLAPGSGRTVAVTFDDAFLSVAEFAYPIMSSLGLPGTVFVVTDFADDERPLAWEGITSWRDGEHAAELRGLSWPQLRDLAEAGWEIGSHTRTHPRLTSLDDERLADELTASRLACEQALGRPCNSIAYPYGDVDRRVVAAAQSAGYRTAATLPNGLPRGRTLSTPRVGVYRGDSLRRFRVKVSPGVRLLRTSWSIAQRERTR
jgi:peptidoglycan/xylan/chitin deacetylase (PgdA/CDA1 family)